MNERDIDINNIFRGITELTSLYNTNFNSKSLIELAKIL